MQENHQVYSASMAGIIINDQKEFLLVQLINADDEDWDFCKGGMHVGENEIETLNREIREELSDDFKYEIIKKSNLKIIYEWSIELQNEKGFRGQARVSYWIKYIDGKIKIPEDELQACKWVNFEELKRIIALHGWGDYEFSTIKNELDQINI